MNCKHYRVNKEMKAMARYCNVLQYHNNKNSLVERTYCINKSSLLLEVLSVLIIWSWSNTLKQECFLSKCPKHLKKSGCRLFIHVSTSLGPLSSFSFPLETHCTVWERSDCSASNWGILLQSSQKGPVPASIRASSSRLIITVLEIEFCCIMDEHYTCIMHHYVKTETNAFWKNAKVPPVDL